MRAAVAVAVLGAAVTLVRSAAPDAAILSARQFTSGVNLVEVYASVVDEQGPVTGLPVGAFSVYEDGQRQNITAFAAGDFPLSVAIAVDRSASMAGKPLALAQRAARGFLGSLRPADRSMVVSISNTVDVVSELSDDRAFAVAAVEALRAWSTTRLHDAIILSLDAIQPGQGRRALVLLSDGVNRESRATAQEVIARARSAGVIIYPVAIGRPRPPLFAQLAVLTGGRSFEVAEDDPKGIEAALDAISRDLRFQYLLGYTPGRPIERGNPEWRNIRVTVDRPGVQVRARDGYMAR